MLFIAEQMHQVKMINLVLKMKKQTNRRLHDLIHIKGKGKERSVSWKQCLIFIRVRQSEKNVCEIHLLVSVYEIN